MYDNLESTWHLLIRKFKLSKQYHSYKRLYYWQNITVVGQMITDDSDDNYDERLWMLIIEHSFFICVNFHRSFLFISVFKCLSMTFKNFLYLFPLLSLIHMGFSKK